MLILGCICAALFSMAHFIIEPPDYIHFFYRFSFGLLASIVFIFRRSLWGIVGLHTGWNFVAISVGENDWRNGGLLHLTGLTGNVEGLANIFVLFFFSFVVYYFLRKRKT